MKILYPFRWLLSLDTYTYLYNFFHFFNFFLISIIFSISALGIILYIVSDIKILVICDTIFLFIFSVIILCVIDYTKVFIYCIVTFYIYAVIVLCVEGNTKIFPDGSFNIARIFSTAASTSSSSGPFFIATQSNIK